MAKTGTLAKGMPHIVQGGEKLQCNHRNYSFPYCKNVNATSTVDSLLFVILYLYRSPASFKSHKQSVDRADPQ